MKNYLLPCIVFCSFIATVEAVEKTIKNATPIDLTFELSPTGMPILKLKVYKYSTRNTADVTTAPTFDSITHDALISKMSAELPHNNIAYERFTANGPMALLPNGEREFSLV